MKRILQAALLLALPFSAHGLIGVDSDGNTTGAVIYMNVPVPVWPGEDDTLIQPSIIRKDGVKYVKVGRRSTQYTIPGEEFFVRRQAELDVQVPIPFTIHPNTTVTVRVDLENMILSQPLQYYFDNELQYYDNFNWISVLTPELRSYGFEPQVRWWDIPLDSRHGLPLTYKLVAGGQRLDSFFVFEITTANTITIPTTDELFISFTDIRLGILPDTPGTFHVSFNYDHGGQQYAKTYTMRDAVKGMDLLEVSATATDVTVDIPGGGTRFKDGANVFDNGLVANIGKISAKSTKTYTAPLSNPDSDPHIHVDREFYS